MSSRRGGAGAARNCRGASQRERRRRGAAIRLHKRAARMLPKGWALSLSLQRHDLARGGVGTGTKTRPAAWADAWLTSKERFLLASVSYVPLGRDGTNFEGGTTRAVHTQGL